MMLHAYEPGFPSETHLREDPRGIVVLRPGAARGDELRAVLERPRLDRLAIAGFAVMDACMILASGILFVGPAQGALLQPWQGLGLGPQESLVQSALVASAISALADIPSRRRLPPDMGAAARLYAGRMAVPTGALAAGSAYAAVYLGSAGAGAAKAWLATALLLALWHALAFAILSLARRAGLFERRVAIYDAVAGSWAGARLAARLRVGPERGIRIVGPFDAAQAGGLDGLLAACRAGSADHVLLLGERGASGLELAIARLAAVPVHTWLLAPVAGPAAGDPMADPLLAVRLAARPLSDWAGAAKSAWERMAALACLILLSPLLLALALAVRLGSAGPVLFRQERFGRNLKPFTILKFRTLYAHAADARAETQVTEGDPRVTGLGHFLRRTGLDELPQLWNVLCGEMALVGPRPHATGMLTAGLTCQAAAPGYERRYLVRPGITGWAQVNGASGPVHDPEQLRRRVALDLHYIDNWSLALDLRIIVATVSWLFRGHHGR